MYHYYRQQGTIIFLVLLPLFFELSLESPVTTTTTTSFDSSNLPKVLSENNLKVSKRPNAEISYFWHQKSNLLPPLWSSSSDSVASASSRLPRLSTINDSTGERIILNVIHRMSDDSLPSDQIEDDVVSTIISNGFGRGRNSDSTIKKEQDDNNNIFVFCLMFLFGLIICGLIWCLCTVSRHQVDNNRDSISSYSSRRINSRFNRSGRRADSEVILPYTSDLPPSYDDIVSDFEKLGAQCILPSYRDIMTKKTSDLDKRYPDSTTTSSPPPQYTSPVGSFSAQGTSEPESTTHP